MNDIHHRTVVTVPLVEEHRYWRKCIQWCEEQWTSGGWWYLGDGQFEFNSDRDAFLFKLRWS